MKGRNMAKSKFLGSKVCLGRLNDSKMENKFFFLNERECASDWLISQRLLLTEYGPSTPSLSKSKDE